MIHTCGIFLINRQNKLLIGHVTNSSNVWSIPKGRMEEGETMLLAALREFVEETSVSLSAIKNFHQLPDVVYKNKKKTLHSFVVFEEEYPSLDLIHAKILCTSMVDNKEQPPFTEIDKFAWVSLAGADVYLHESQSRCLNEIINLMNKNNK